MHRNGIAIEVKHLTRVYRGSNGRSIVANDDLSFCVPRGEIFGLFGANGAGKTTLVMQMLGLLRPTSGSLVVEGIDVVDHPERVKSQIGFLPQTGLAMRHLEVRRALHYTGRLRGQSELDALQQTSELLEQLGLVPHAERYVDKLSGGMMRLVNFGMALMGRPKVLILDEPTNELDPQNRRLVWDTIRRLNMEEGTTVVLVTHNVLEAEKAIQRVAVMNGGRIVALGTPGQLKERVGSQARFDLYLKEDAVLSAEEVARLGELGAVDVPRERHYQLFLPPERVASAARIVTDDVGLDRVDDYRIARLSLEDVYLHLDRVGANAADLVTTALELRASPSQADADDIDLSSDEAPFAARARGRGGVGFWVALKHLWLEQMFEVRTTWSWSLLFSVLMPIAMVFGLSRIGHGLTDRSSLLFIISGAAVFSIATEGILTLAQRIGVIRRDGMLLYYASLPISMASFIAAIVLARFLIIVPGLITPIIAGSLMYGIELEISPIILLVMPLACLSLSAIGIAIGSFIHDLDLIIVVTNLMIFVLLLAAPVLIPAESLPSALRVLGYFLPPTYAADALRRSLDGQFDTMVITDLSALALMACVSLFAASRWIRWRTA
jgi:ABC-2 type transport system permease protein